MTWFIVGSVLAVLAIGGHLLARGWPLVPKLLFATGLLVAAPTLIAQGLGGTSWIFGQLSPVSGPAAWLVLLIPAGFTAGLLALLRGVPWFDLGRIPLASVAIVLVLFAVVTAPLLAIGISSGEPQKAEHTWAMTLTPSDPGIAYTVELPFLAAFKAEDEPLVDRLRDRLEVRSGQAQVELTRDGTWLVIEGQGPVEVVAHDTYYGDIGDREALTNVGVRAANATLSVDGDLSLDLDIDYSFSGGTGHTCWADGRMVGQASGPGTFPLTLVIHGDREPVWQADDVHHLPAVCA